MATKKPTAPADPFQAARDAMRQSDQVGFRVRADQKAKWTAAAVAAGAASLADWIKSTCDEAAEDHEARAATGYGPGAKEQR